METWGGAAGCSPLLSTRVPGHRPFALCWRHRKSVLFGGVCFESVVCVVHISDAMLASSQPVEQILVREPAGSGPEWRHCPLIEVDRAQKNALGLATTQLLLYCVCRWADKWKNQFKDAYFHEFVLI